MLDLFRWETAAFWKSRKGATLLIVTLVLAAAFVAISFANEVDSGVIALSDGVGFFSSLMVFFVPIYAGLVVAQSFEDRLIQAAVMSGQTRLSIVAVKTLFFMLVSFTFLALGTLISTLVVTAIHGWGAADLGISSGEIIGQILALILLTVIAYTIVVPLVFYTKKVGTSIGVGFVVSLVLYSLTQEAMKRESLHPLLKATPLGRSFFISGEAGAGFWIATIAVGVLWVAAYILAAHLLFRNQELK